MIESIRIEPEPGQRVPTEALRREFPTLEVMIGPDRPPTRELRIEAEEWATKELDFVEFDRIVDQLVSDGPTGVAVGGGGAQAEECAIEILTRCQRWIDRRNAESAGAAFDRLLVRHQAMHDVTLPLVNADYRHALDTWQWVLRLEAGATLSLQAAALFHDIERMALEARTRAEHLAASDEEFRAARAEAAAARAAAVLEDVRMHPLVVDRVQFLIAGHGGSGDDRDLRVLNDAGALSFFSLSCPGFLDDFGPVLTRRKIRYALGRLSPLHRQHLSRIRMRPDFAALLAAEAGGAPAPAAELAGGAVA